MRWTKVAHVDHQDKGGPGLVEDDEIKDPVVQAIQLPRHIPRTVQALQGTSSKKSSLGNTNE